jgi:hypothetical protein
MGNAGDGCGKPPLNWHDPGKRLSVPDKVVLGVKRSAGGHGRLHGAIDAFAIRQARPEFAATDYGWAMHQPWCSPAPYGPVDAVHIA